MNQRLLLNAGSAATPWRSAGWVLAACAFSVMTKPAAAQGITVADASIQSLDRAQAEQARLKALIDNAPKAYEDRFMGVEDAGSSTSDDTVPEAQGFRSWLYESRIGFGHTESTGFGKRHAIEFGLRTEQRLDTLNYGEFLLQADVRHLNGDPNSTATGFGALGYARERTSDRITIRNLGLPVAGGVYADTAIGDIYSDLTDGLSRNYRLSLGSSTVRGLSTRVFSNDFDLRAGAGERGYLAGGPYPGFEKSQGSLAWLGFTKRLGDNLFAAVQVDRANGIPASYYNLFSYNGIGSKNVTSWAASVGYGKDVLRDGDFKVRTTVIGSRTTGSSLGVLQDGDAQGLFVEAATRWGRSRHEFGAYAARPNLYFGDYALTAGTRGAYWRMDTSSTRLNWGAGLDYEHSAPSTTYLTQGYTRAGASANFQYLLDRYTSFGANLNVYQSRYASTALPSTETTSRSLYGNAFYQTRFFDWGRSRFNLTVRRNESIVVGSSAATGEEIQWEQDWITGRYETMRPELTTTLGYARDRSSGVAHTYPTAGVQFRYWFDSTLYLGGDLRYTSQSGGLYTSRGLSGSLSAEKEIGNGWRVGMAVNLNQARFAVQQTSLFTPQVSRTNDKSAYVYLRWEGSKGSSYQPAGMATGYAGAGSVRGQVFFDANRDGAQQSGENGVANVEVLLDNRYRAVTDRDGRFEFPMVVTGRHQLTLSLDTVPLPWGASAESGVSVNVPLRGQATAEIPVVKVGE